MQSFFSKRPRQTPSRADTADTADDGKRPRLQLNDVLQVAPEVQSFPHPAGKTSLAITKSDPELLSLEPAAIQLFESYPIEEWYNLGNYLLNRQLLFGSRPSSHRTPHSEYMPQVLLDIFQRARTLLMSTAPKFGDIPLVPGGCAINRYPTTANGKGAGIGPHKDKGEWQPLVIGVTLVESRRVAFTQTYQQTPDKAHTVVTPAGSVYGFRDEMYTQWFHQVMKKGGTQRKTIYSITYRFRQNTPSQTSAL